MNTKEVLCTIGDKIETDADNYRNVIESGGAVMIREKTDDGVVVVTIYKERK